MNKVDKLVKAHKGMDYFSIDGQGKKTIRAFINYDGEMLIINERTSFEKVDALGLAAWINDVYSEPIEFTPEAVEHVERAKRAIGAVSLDNQPIMNEIRDKHSAMDPVEDGNGE